MSIQLTTGMELSPGMQFIPKLSVITSGLQLHLDAASYSGSGTTWTALQGANATLYNTPTYISASPTYFSFDKVSKQYAAGSDLGTLTNWTVECWFRATSSLSSQITTLIGDQYDLSSKINWSLCFNNLAQGTGVLMAAFFNGSWRYTSGFVPTLNTWYYVAGTYDGATIKQYQNGSLQSSTGYAGTPSSSGLGYRIAARWDDMSSSIDYFPGDIAIARVYNTALTSSQIDQNFQAQRSRFNI